MIATECWTPWFDRDNPSGTGDYETLSKLRKENPSKICDKPVKIDVKTKAGADVGLTGDVIHVSDVYSGFICRNRDQAQHGLCADYKVRFLCPLEFCKPKGNQCWTSWFDRDNPSGTGDYETLSRLRKENPSKICDHPVKIEAKTTSGASIGSTGNVIRVSDTIKGFICQNRDQPQNGHCADYKVRFSCPLEFCKPKECWTPWFDRDNPSGNGDYEILSRLRKENPSEICDYPVKIEAKTTSGASVGSPGNVIHVSDTTTGFICQNRDQPQNGRCADYKVRFLCPHEFCKPKETPECWTSWFDRDNPSGTGDYETLSRLREENPSKICEHPVKIEAKTTSGASVGSTGDVIHAYDTVTGFECRNNDQRHNGLCADYKVRFLCPLEFCKPNAQQQNPPTYSAHSGTPTVHYTRGRTGSHPEWAMPCRPTGTRPATLAGAQGGYLGKE
nr:mucin-5AC-like [Nerophis lumbriciformis]